ncbi:MAG: hypothetical protein MJZ61_02940 [Bacteroidales bacterium]|nr:hypothetical protein [Bacteroidales bacterium]
MRTFWSLLILLALCAESIAQNKYLSREFYGAVSRGSRTLDGLPGANYKNNYVKYKMDIQFDPESHILEGVEDAVLYFNMPCDGTDYVYLNLYRNIYKKGVVRTRNCHPDDITDNGMEILEVQRVLPGGSTKKLDCKFTDTKMKVKLDEPLRTGRNITLRIKWRNKIAAITKHRGGQYGDYSWFIPYFYPQIAVFDDIYGWDEVEHHANEEFLQEFASYDVNLSLGNNMCAWATGTLQNAASIYKKPVADLIRKASLQDAETPIITRDNVGKVLQKERNVWHFKADSVTDFAFSCSDNMLWTLSSVKLAPGSPRTVVDAVYRSDGFASVVDWSKKTLQYLSTQRPAYVYPYPHITIFEGSGGMEFPMMVNEDYDGKYDSDFFTTSHEVTHSYFPFITGMYQNRFGFMDEGLTQYVPQYFQNQEFQQKDIIANAALYTQYTAQMEGNLPVVTPSFSYIDLAVFTVNSYYKPQMAYTAIEKAVDADVMDKILHEFVISWKGRHPHPIDFFNLCESISGKNLAPLVRSWFYSLDYPDLAIDVAGRDITVRNLGGLMLPVYLEVDYVDGTSEVLERSPLDWADGAQSITIPLGKDIRRATLGNSHIPDVDIRNNRFSN